MSENGLAVILPSYFKIVKINCISEIQWIKTDIEIL